MISCNVIVVRATGGQTEEWGAFDFLGLPSPADRIMVVKDGRENYATVISVHHYPTVSGSGELPSAEIVAKWTGAGQKIR